MNIILIEVDQCFLIIHSPLLINLVLYHLLSYNYGLIFCVYGERGNYKNGEIWVNLKYTLIHKIKQLYTQT